MLTYKIKLKSIEKSSDGNVSYLIFELKQKFDFQEGQFVMLESINYKLNGETIKRAYSIATTNQRLQTKNEIGFIIKKASEKGLSYYLTKKINIGDQLELTGPFGHLTNPNTYRKYLFISIGSGIAALHPHYIHLTQETKDYDKIVNIFGERYQSNILPHLEKLFSENNKKIKNFLFFSKEKEIPKGYNKGHVQDKLDEVFEFLEDNNFITILCGKPVMVESIEKILLERGLNKDQILFEKY